MLNMPMTGAPMMRMRMNRRIVQGYEDADDDCDDAWDVGGEQRR